MIPLPSYQETAASAIPSLRSSLLTTIVTAMNKSSEDWNSEPKTICYFPEARMNFDGLLQGDLQLLHNQHESQSLGVVTSIYDVQMEDY